MRTQAALFLILFASLFPFFTSTAIFADVTVERFVKSGFGESGSSEGYEKEYLKGLAKRTDRKVIFTGRVVGMRIKPKNHSTIYRVDRGVIYEVNHVKKTFSERPMFISHKGQSVVSDDEGYQGVEKEHESDSREGEALIRSSLKVIDTGLTRSINGFPCKQYLLTGLVETEKVSTKERVKTRLKGEVWKTREKGAVKTLGEEEEAFERAYAGKLGFDMKPEVIRRFGLAVLGEGMRIGSADLMQELSKMEGYPIITAVTWETGDHDEEHLLKEPQGMSDSRKEKRPTGDALKKELRSLFDLYTEILQIDTSKVRDVTFDVPGEYRKEDNVLIQDTMSGERRTE